MLQLVFLYISKTEYVFLESFVVSALLDRKALLGMTSCAVGTCDGTSGLTHFVACVYTSGFL